MTKLPSAAELAGPILDAFNASPQAAAFDRTPKNPFVAGNVKNEVDKAFNLAARDGLTDNLADFMAWTTGELSYLLRWAQGPGRVTPDGEPMKALVLWLDTWAHALPTMDKLAASNLIGGKAPVGGNPYYRHFEKTYPVFDAYRASGKDTKALAAALGKLERGAEIVAWLGLK